MANDLPGLPLVGGQDAAPVASLNPPPVVDPSTVLVPVRFVRQALPYNPGDIAGFAPDYAERLIAAKVAEALAPDDGPADPTAGAEAAAKSGGKGRTPKPSGGAASGDANDL